MSSHDGYINEIEAVPWLATCLARAVARVAAQAGDDATNDVIGSDVIRRNDLQVWFVAGHLGDEAGNSPRDMCARTQAAECRTATARPSWILADKLSRSPRHIPCPPTNSP